MPTQSTILVVVHRWRYVKLPQVFTYGVHPCNLRDLRGHQAREPAKLPPNANDRRCDPLTLHHDWSFCPLHLLAGVRPLFVFFSHIHPFSFLAFCQPPRSTVLTLADNRPTIQQSEHQHHLRDSLSDPHSSPSALLGFTVPLHRDFIASRVVATSSCAYTATSSLAKVQPKTTAVLVQTRIQQNNTKRLVVGGTVLPSSRFN